MRGRKPKPIELQIAEGDPSMRGPGKLREMLDAQVKAAPGLPDCPKHLKGRARYAWNFWAEELAVMQIDKRPDAVKLEGACVSYARAVEADLILEREGIIVKNQAILEDGEVVVLNVRKHPAVDVSSRCWAAVRAFGSDFGFDPTSRVRLSLAKSDAPKDRHAEMLAALTQPRDKPREEQSVN